MERRRRRRTPFSVLTASWRTRSTVRAISALIASCRGAEGLRRASLASRGRVSRGVSEWMVQIEPGWPVFIASSRSSASAPRTSPITIRSGLMRRASWTSRGIPIAPRPSMLAGRPSSETQSGSSRQRCSSAWSSMVTSRSPGGISRQSVRTKVVFPVPVPPATSTFRRALTTASRKGMDPSGRKPARARSASSRKRDGT